MAGDTASGYEADHYRADERSGPEARRAPALGTRRRATVCRARTVSVLVPLRNANKKKKRKHRLCVLIRVRGTIRHGEAYSLPGLLPLPAR